MSRARFTLLASLLVALAFVLANALSHRLFQNARLDLTERGLYTLAEGTRSTLDAIGEPTTLTFVYTRSVGADYPAIRTHAARVRELLAAYESRSGGGVVIREIDPAPFSEEEDVALAAGITAVPTDGGDPLYMGLIGENLADDQVVLPFLAPERDSELEYELTRTIARLNAPEPATIGVLTTIDNLRGDGTAGGYRVVQDLAERFDVMPVPEDFVELPEEAGVLLIAHPPSLSARQLYLIDQFMMAGGRVLVFVDPASKAALAGASILDVDPAEGRSDMPDLLAHYGLSLPDEIAADRDHALPIRVDAGDGRSVVVNQPLFFAIAPENMNPEAGATADLARTINLGAPGYLDRLPVEGVTQTPLLSTGPAAAALPPGLADDSVSPMEVLDAYVPERQLVLAYGVEGASQSLFDAREEPDIPDDPVYAEIVRAQLANPPEHRSRSDGPVQMIVVADTDLLDDGFYVDPASGEAVADNGAFVLNAVEALSGEVDLNALRARAPALRPMTRVDKLRQDAQAAFFEEQSRLEARLREAEARLEELRLSGGGSDFLDQTGLASLTPAEQGELERLRAEILDTRARLRKIEGDFRRDIDALESRLRLLNIWTMPLLVIFGWLAWMAWRRRRA